MIQQLARHHHKFDSTITITRTKNGKYKQPKGISPKCWFNCPGNNLELSLEVTQMMISVLARTVLFEQSFSMHVRIAFWWNSSSIFIVCYKKEQKNKQITALEPLHSTNLIHPSLCYTSKC